MPGPAQGRASLGLLNHTSVQQQQLDAAAATANDKGRAAVPDSTKHLTNGLAHAKGRRASHEAVGGLAAAGGAVSTPSMDSSSSTIGSNSCELSADPKGKDGHQRHSSLLAPIPPELQLNLRWERICAFVTTDYDEPGLLSKGLSRCRGQPVAKQEKKQVGGCSVFCVCSTQGVGEGVDAGGGGRGALRGAGIRRIQWR